MIKHRKISTNDWLLLSAYLDGQLSVVEKRQIDERLQSDPECRMALDTLRRTSTLLRSLPVRRAPRNFTLSASSLVKKSNPPLIGILRFSSAAAALLLVAIFTFDLTLGSRAMSINDTAQDAQPEIAMESAKRSSAEAPNEEAPVIIFWGAPTSMMGAYGKGGGGGGAEGPGLGGGAALQPYGIGGGAAEETLPDAASPVEEQPASDAAPDMEMPAPEVLEEQQPETEPQPQERVAPEPLSGSGPILGVQPMEELSAADKTAEVPLRQPAVQLDFPFRLIEIVLAALLILTAIPAWLIKRK